MDNQNKESGLVNSFFIDSIRQLGEIQGSLREQKIIIGGIKEDITWLRVKVEDHEKQLQQTSGGKSSIKETISLVGGVIGLLSPIVAIIWYFASQGSA